MYDKKEYREGRFQKMWLDPECFILCEFFITGYKGRLVVVWGLDMGQEMQCGKKGEISLWYA